MLYLIERVLEPGDAEQSSALFDKVREALGRAGADLVEIQVSTALGRAYFIADLDGPAARIEAQLRVAGIAFDSVSQVRLVGADLETVKAARGNATYLVEWDLPAALTMVQYLARKEEQAPL